MKKFLKFCAFILLVFGALSLSGETFANGKTVKSLTSIDESNLARHSDKCHAKVLKKLNEEKVANSKEYDNIGAVINYYDSCRKKDAKRAERSKRKAALSKYDAYEERHSDEWYEKVLNDLNYDKVNNPSKYENIDRIIEYYQIRREIDALWSKITNFKGNWRSDESYERIIRKINDARLLEPDMFDNFDDVIEYLEVSRKLSRLRLKEERFWHPKKYYRDILRKLNNDRKTSERTKFIDSDIKYYNIRKEIDELWSKIDNLLK